MVTVWIAENFIEIFGAVTGIAYVILEIKRNIFLWPLGIITSAVYMYVFGREGFYANMGLQGYYLLISIYGWYKWHGASAGGRRGVACEKRSDRARKAEEQEVTRSASYKAGQGTSPLSSSSENAGDNKGTAGREDGSDIMRINVITAIGSSVTALLIWALLWYVLDRWTDSPVPVWDGLIASLSVVATWMLTRKILEQWYVWIVANAIAVAVYMASGLYPTAVLFFVYFVMAVIGLKKWRRDAPAN